MTDSNSLVRAIQAVQPGEVYNLAAAQSHVAVSFEESGYAANSDALVTLCFLEAIIILVLEAWLVNQDYFICVCNIRNGKKHIY